MKPILISLFILSSWAISHAQPALSYYLPESTSYDSSIPTPASVIGHEVGEYHVTHDQLVNYMQVLDKASDRISLAVTGHTHEGRPILLLTITSPENHGNIESIRTQHLQLTNASSSASLNTSSMPAVFYLGCSIHGNEASGSNAGLLIAYHLAAAQGAEIQDALKNTVILFDPSFNPDGLQRFASWVNSRKSKMTSSDPSDMEHHEPWPGGRTNHYWFDLNRDWLVAQQPESKARIKTFHQWKPNVLTDHHEMGTHYTFFFQPGVPSRSHPITPVKNFELTKKIGEFHAKALDEIGSLYYTQEGYDDFYYGKGSTFPDAQGAVGILFEQASSRGHRQESENGVLTFPFTIRNQFTAALSSLKAVNAMREELLNYQRQFYREAAAESRKDPVKALIFGSSKDKARAYLLAEIISQHDIRIYRSQADQTFNGKSFDAASSFVVPMDQDQYKLLKGMFETRTQFQDSLFYDISSWTLPLAVGIEFEELRSVPALGDQVSVTEMPAGKVVGGKSEYAYVFESFGYYAPRAIYRLLREDIRIKVSTDPFFHSNGKKFESGAILIPLTGQEKGAGHIDFLIQQIVEKDGLDVYAFHTGLDYQGSSLGSYSFRPLKKPEIAVLVGNGVSAQDAGEIWHLLDTRFEIPATMLPLEVFNTVDINRYNTLIFPQGAYGTITDIAKEKLKTWIQNGGVVIGMESALQWFQASGLGKFEMKNGAESAKTDPPARPYSAIEETRGAQATSGAIFNATVDLSHPLLFGYYRQTLPIFKGNNLFLEKSKNPFGNPILFTAEPLMSGYISKRNYEKVRGASVAGVAVMGRGRVIGFTENLTFRAFWFGTNKLLMNAIFYGPLIDPGAAR